MTGSNRPAAREGFLINVKARVDTALLHKPETPPRNEFYIQSTIDVKQSGLTAWIHRGKLLSFSNTTFRYKDETIQRLISAGDL